MCKKIAIYHTFKFGVQNCFHIHELSLSTTTYILRFNLLEQISIMAGGTLLNVLAQYTSNKQPLIHETHFNFQIQRRKIWPRNVKALLIFMVEYSQS